MEKKKLLIVDDELSRYADSLRSTMESKGIHLDIVDNSVDALEILSKKSFDLIMIDINLSDDDSGIELLKKIRKTDQTTKISILTGYPEYEEKAIAAGANNFLVKPIRPREHIFEPLGIK